jgi:hypothetical protein
LFQGYFKHFLAVCALGNFTRTLLSVPWVI